MHMLISGLGYAGAAVARLAVGHGFTVTATSRDPARADAPPGVTMVAFGDGLPDRVTHVLATAPPIADGDPVLAVYGPALAASGWLHWAGYLSTTGVYGDRAGGWVDETTPVAPGNDRSLRRVTVEQAWAALAPGIAVDLFRVSGIYGPGRSAFDDLRAGRARRIMKLGHSFGRIHRDDIAGAVMAAAASGPRFGLRTFNLSDNVPSESAAVIEEAASLCGLPLPAAVAFEAAAPAMSAMARSFWSENRKVCSRRTQEILGYSWRYPSYREGLRAILAEMPP